MGRIGWWKQVTRRICLRSQLNTLMLPVNPHFNSKVIQFNEMQYTLLDRNATPWTQNSH